MSNSISSLDLGSVDGDASSSIGMAQSSPSTDSSTSHSRNATPVPSGPLSPPRGGAAVQQQHMTGGALNNSSSSVPSSPASSTKNDPDRSPIGTPTRQPNQRQQQQAAWPLSAPILPDQEESGMALGLEQLERQQDEAERRRRAEQIASTTPVRQPQQQQPPSQPPSQQHQQHHPIPAELMQQFLEDDDNTAPSSTLESNQTRATDAASSHVGDGSTISGDDTHNSGSANAQSFKFGSIIKSTRKHLSSKDYFQRRRSRSNGDAEEEPVEEDEEDEDDVVQALIYGHLQKLGRNGKWQTRWFETDGECLSYYKSSKRTKLLATLDLEKVGAIVVNDEDPKGCSFTIQVLGRPYYLRAESRAACKDWVITLNRVKEARLQQGNVKLVKLVPSPRSFGGGGNPPDLLDRNVSTYTPGVVAVANRQRTRAVDESTIENMEDMIPSSKNSSNKTAASLVQQTNTPEFTAAYNQNDELTHLQQVVLARWSKRKTAMSRLATKVARWARSLNKYKCNEMDNNDVRLDPNVHPPGHDDVRQRPVSAQPGERDARAAASDPGLSGWIGKGGSLAVNAGPVVLAAEDTVQGVDQATSDSVQLAASATTPTEEEETRELS